MRKIDFETHDKMMRKLSEISDLAGCVKDVLTLLNCSDTAKCETLLRLEAERIDELYAMMEELEEEEEV